MTSKLKTEGHVGVIPEKLDESGDAARLEECEQTLAVVRQVVKGSGSALQRLHVVARLHGSH